MGARAPLETDSVAVAVYGLPVRTAVVAGLLVLLLAACSGSSGSKKGGGSSGPPACPLVAKLDETAASVATADVSDPVAFQKTLTTATNQYVTTIRQLKPLVPAAVQADLDRFEAAVHQGRYKDALANRASLDAYAASACGRTATTTTTVAGVAAETTTVPVTAP